MIASKTRIILNREQARPDIKPRRASSRPLKPGIRRAKKLLATGALAWTFAFWLMLAFTENQPSSPNSLQPASPPAAQSSMQNPLEQSEQK